MHDQWCFVRSAAIAVSPWRIGAVKAWKSWFAKASKEKKKKEKKKNRNVKQ